MVELKVRLYDGTTGISSSPFMITRSLHNNISKIRALFFPKWPKIYAYILSCPSLETNSLIFDDFLICPPTTV